MAECIILKGGGGADLDVITAGASDVLAGKVTVDKDGNPLPGTMHNRGTGYHGVGVGLNTQGLYYYIGPGYYYENPTNNPWVYMSRAEVAATLGIEPWKMRGDVNVCGVQGGIPIQGADVSGTDRAWATNMSNWAGTINLGVRNGHFLNGVNWIQVNIPEYQPWNIKKGVNMGGQVGTFEGYVANPTDLYYRGNNAIGFVNVGGSRALIFDSGQITIAYVELSSSIDEPKMTGTFNTIGKTYLNFEINITAIRANSTSEYLNIYFPNVPRVQAGPFTLGTRTYSINVQALQMNGNVRIEFGRVKGAVYRVWLS